jgi:hypothetical protein
MGKINLKIRDEIEQKFREEVFKRKGLKKGNLTKAVEEAMILWINVGGKTSSQNKEAKLKSR